MRKTDTAAYSIALLIGMAVWFVASWSGGRREPWDDPNYWSMAYPIAIFASGALGFFFTDRTWRWPLALFMGQFLAMTIRNGELGNLWPLGLLLFATLSIPGIILAKLGAWINGKLSPHQP